MQVQLPQPVAPYSPEYKDAQIKQYCVSGYALFPCGQQNDPKAPKYKKWQESPYDPFLTAGDLPLIYGVVLKDDDLVLDFDPRRGEDQLEKLWKTLELDRTETYIVKTGGGGLHLYFKKPAGVPMRARVPGFDAIEIKTAGKYVVASGSKHPSGNYYEVVRGNLRKREFAPQSLLELCTSPEAIEGVGVETDDTDTQRVFIHYLMGAPAAEEGNGGSDTTYVVAARGKDYGLSEEITYSLMLDHYNHRCTPEWSEADLRAHVAHAYQYGQNAPGCKNALAQFSEYNHGAASGDYATETEAATAIKIRWDTSIVQGQTKLDGTLRNAVNYFLIPHSREARNPLYGLLRLNLFNGRIEFSRPAPWHKSDRTHAYWKDTDAVMLKYYLQTGDDGKRGAFTGASKQLCDEAAIAVAQMHQYDPVVEWLDDTKWDGKARLDRWLVTYCGAPDTAYVREVGKNTLIAACARGYQPGCKHDSMLVMEGGQDIGKSSVASVLGGEFYADVKIAVETPQEIQRTTQSMQLGWILEASEMEFTRKAEINAIKRFLTLQVDITRLPYEKYDSVLPRRSIFIGSVNPTDEGYLRDKTGNRRFWPVAVTTISLEALARDREQLFAEAVVRYRKGEKWWITDPSIKAIAMAEQALRVEGDAWDEIISNWLTVNNVQEILTTEYIAMAALNLPKHRIGRTEKSRLCNAMRAAGYTMGTIWDKDNRKNVFAWKRAKSSLLSQI